MPNAAHNIPRRISIFNACPVRFTDTVKASGKQLEASGSFNTVHVSIALICTFVAQDKRIK